MGDLELAEREVGAVDCEHADAEMGVVEVLEVLGAGLEYASAIGVSAGVRAVREADVGLEAGVVGCQRSEIGEFVQV